MSYAYTLSLRYPLIYVRAATFLALIPDERGVLLKFYETYIKLWLPTVSVYLLQSLGECVKKTVFLKTYPSPAWDAVKSGLTRESAF